MSNKEEFKLFVKSHPELIRYVKNGEMTWQKFYETYSLYGKENDVWNKYFNNNEEIKENTNEKKENVHCCKKIITVTGSVEERIAQIKGALKELNFL